MLTNNLPITATVWLVDSRIVDEVNLARGFSWLNAEEIARYDAFVKLQRKNQFLIGRILLRLALAKLLNISPESLALTERVNQAPLLQWSAPAPGFSLSHSGPWVACAVSLNTALGLDLEVIDTTRDVDALSTYAFDVDEISLFKQLEVGEKLNGFYTLWSTKEAKYKLVSNAQSLGETSKKISCINLSQRDFSMVLCSADILFAAPEMIRSDLAV